MSLHHSCRVEWAQALCKPNPRNENRNRSVFTGMFVFFPLFEKASVCVLVNQLLTMCRPSPPAGWMGTQRLCGDSVCHAALYRIFNGFPSVIRIESPGGRSGEIRRAREARAQQQPHSWADKTAGNWEDASAPFLLSPDTLPSPGGVQQSKEQFLLILSSDLGGAGGAGWELAVLVKREKAAR